MTPESSIRETLYRVFNNDIKTYFTDGEIHMISQRIYDDLKDWGFIADGY